MMKSPKMPASSNFHWFKKRGGKRKPYPFEGVTIASDIFQKDFGMNNFEFL